MKKTTTQIISLLMDSNKCIGCGTCSFLAPRVFKIGKNGKADLLKQDVQLTGEVDEAIAGCPVKAITHKK